MLRDAHAHTPLQRQSERTPRPRGTRPAPISVVTPSTPVQAQSGDDSPQYEKTLLAELKLEYTSMAAGYLPGCDHVDDHSNGGSTAKATVASPAADANAASVDVSDDGE